MFFFLIEVQTYEISVNNANRTVSLNHGEEGIFIDYRYAEFLRFF